MSESLENPMHTWEKEDPDLIERLLADAAERAKAEEEEERTKAGEEARELETTTTRDDISNEGPESADDQTQRSQSVFGRFRRFVTRHIPARLPGRNTVPGSLNRLPQKAASTAAAPQHTRPEKRARDLRGENKSDSEGEKRIIAAKRKKQRKPLSTESKRFDCPFNKRNPGAYPCWKSIGYANVSRLKGHLYRTHLLPDTVQCCRCHKHFDKQEELTKHYRSGEALGCPRLNVPAVEGITKEQHAALLKISPKGQDEEKKWVDVYLLLFPNDREVPSPYRNNQEPLAPPESCSSATSYLQEVYAGLEEYMAAEVPQRFRDRLRMLDEESNLCLSDSQRSGVQALLPKISLEILQDFRNQKQRKALEPGAEGQGRSGLEVTNPSTSPVVGHSDKHREQEPRLINSALQVPGFDHFPADMGALISDGLAQHDAPAFRSEFQPSQEGPTQTFNYDPSSDTINHGALFMLGSEYASVPQPENTKDHVFRSQNLSQDAAPSLVSETARIPETMSDVEYGSNSGIGDLSAFLNDIDNTVGFAAEEGLPHTGAQHDEDGIVQNATVGSR